MKFVQIIQYSTSRPDDVQSALDAFLAATQGKRENSRAAVGRDRDQANVYYNVVEFPSYEVAMKNSEAPETRQLAEAMQKLCDGPPTFRNLDVIFEE